ncbi:MAG: arylsulfatase [Verrucomicrobia bacterium]|nr:arylsulfatase [Verrucomicrobiota bacterium]
MKITAAFRILHRALPVAALIASVAAASAADKPNIIYILADDLGLGDLGCYGQKHFATPNIDKLAADGIRFTQHYSGTSVCAPSRSSLLTGLHTGHTPIRGNMEVKPEGQQPLPAGTLTLATLLQKSGYATGAFGKWGLGFPGSEGDPLKQGFDRFFGYNCQRLGHNYYPRHLWDDDKKLELDANAGQKKGVYAPELIHEKTLAFLEANKDRPFFCYVATIIPHAEMVAPERYMARHRGKYGVEKPFKGKDDGADYRNGQYESQPEPHAARAAMINLLDDQVGEIVAKIKQLGLAEKTLIIFTSDNGPSSEGGSDPAYFDSAAGLRGSKRDLYEGGIRAPMVAAWPGKIAPGKTTDLLSAFWDVLPTCAELAGQPVPAGVDGISFVPTLLGQGTQAQHGYLYWEFHEMGGRVALRQGDWKVVRYNVAKNSDGPLQLFNLAEDPAEKTDLADKFPDRVQQMGKILRAARTESPLFKFTQGGYLQKH